MPTSSCLSHKSNNNTHKQIEPQQENWNSETEQDKHRSIILITNIQAVTQQDTVEVIRTGV